MVIGGDKLATKDIGQLRTRLSWEDDGAERSLQGFRRDLKGLRSEMNLARSRGKEFTSSLKGMRNQSDILSRKLKTQQERVKELRKRYKELADAGKEDTVQAKNLASQINNANAQINRTESQLRNLSAEIKRMESPWTQIGERMTKTGDKMQSFGRSMTSFGRDYSMKVTAPIVAGGTAMVKSSIDYESAFAGVRKTVDATEEEYQALSDGIREMTKVLPASAVEIAGVAESAGQLGIKKENILDFTRTMIDMGEATNLSSEQAATEFARFANIVGMSQKDFDRLGSVVVDLGNNLATTESEVVSMGMRLAGAGKQIGMSEAEIMSFAGALSSVGIEAEAGGTAFSKVMTKMQLSTQRGGKELEQFAKVAGMSASDFKKSFEKDAAGAILKFIEGLSKAEEQGESANSILDEMGLTEVRLRDALLRASGASDVFSDSLQIGTKAWEENTALTEEAEERYKTTESQLKILWNRIKDVAITMGDALAPALLDAIDAAEPLIQKIEDGAQAFSEMDKEQQQTILKMIALAAAIGPASIGIGQLSSGVGGLLKIGGSAAKMLGRTGGKGLVGKIGLLGMGGPVGLAVGGVGALLLVMHKLRKEEEKLNEVSLDKANSMMKEYETTGEMIEQFDKLRGKSKLTNDEFARYIDLQAMLEDATGKAEIEAIQKEMGRLQDKSGLSNKELSTMVGLNGDLTEQLPGATEMISEQGEKIAGNTSELKKYNEEVRQMALNEMSKEFYEALENQEKHLERKVELQGLIKDAKEKESTIDSLINDYTQENIDYVRGQIADEQAKIIEKLASNELTKREREELGEQKDINDGILGALRDGKGELAEQLVKMKGQRTEQEIKLNKTEQELTKLGRIYDQLQLNYLKEAGINDEKALQAVKNGNALKMLDNQLKKLEDQKRKIKEQTPASERNTEEYRNAVSEIDNQITGLENAKTKIGGLEKDARLYTKELGKDVDKEVDVDDKGGADKLNKEVKKKQKKDVDVKFSPLNTVKSLVPNWVSVGVKWLGKKLPGFADGTDYHLGGPALVGEKGQELAKIGNKWSVLDLGVYDLPKGTQVFTHDESKKILQSLNNIPAYANGVSPVGEADRITSRFNSDDKYTRQLLNATLKQNIILGELLKKDNKAVVAFDSVYQPIKRRLNEDQYSQLKQRRRR